jgi:hypothetical protein
VSVASHEQLHHDGAEAEDQSREVQHSHRARVAQRRAKDRWKHKKQLHAGRVGLAFGP